MTRTLRECLARAAAAGLCEQDSGACVRADGKKLNHTYREVQRLCEDQKIENFVFHDLRHWAVTNLADNGVEIETIMKIVGHSCVEMFLRYRKIKPEKLDAAMARLDRLGHGNGTTIFLAVR